MECLSICLNDQNMCSLIIIATVLTDKYIWRGQGDSSFSKDIMIGFMEDAPLYIFMPLFSLQNPLS